MTRLSFVLLTVVTLATAPACGKKAGGDCASSVGGAMDRLLADAKATGDRKEKPDPEMVKLMAAVRATTIQSCVDDKWPDAALKCLDDAKTSDAAQKCDALLTPEQVEKRNAAEKALFGEKKDEPKKAPDSQAVEKVMTEMTGFKDRMCACKDKDCADKVQVEMAKAMSQYAAKNPKLSEEQTQRATKTMLAFVTCQTAASGPPPAP